MKWPWGSEINKEQRRETAKAFIAIAQLIFIGLLASPFVPELKTLNTNEQMYGIVTGTVLYFSAMRLLRKD